MKNKTAYFYLFLFSYLSILFVLGRELWIQDKAMLHLQMNDFHTKEWDVFFRYFTDIGGGTIPFLFIALLLLYRYSVSLYLLSAQLLGGIVSVVGKRIFDEPRPFSYFQEHLPDIQLPLVEGVKIHYSYSFPSGHTITAFALVMCILLVIKNKYWSIPLLLIASLVGYSRIYLSQHFAIDVFVGSIIGVISALCTYPLFLRMDKTWNKRSLINRKQQ